MRVAIMFENFGPYHVARLVGAVEAGLDVLAVEVSKKSNIYEWVAPEIPKKVSYVNLNLASAGRKQKDLFFALNKHVLPFMPNAIALPGWASDAALCSLNWAAMRGVPTVVMSESNEFDFRRITLVEAAKRSIVRCYGAGVTSGLSGKRYLVGLGMEESVVFDGYDVIDNSYFEVRANEVRKNTAMPVIGRGRTLERRWCGQYFLASARFVPKKNLHRLIEGYRLYRLSVESERAWPLVIIGEGVLRSKLEEQINEYNLNDFVYLPGFIQYDQLPLFYGTAGGFVHASTTEQWGLVVNEAMASGLPVAVSSRCGCGNAG
jgi:1,2-diacylglycerol 3-alpha-glucosyltransferase